MSSTDTDAKSYALVTGASRGIGAAIAEELARQGHPILLNYRSDHVAAEGTRNRILNAGGAATLFPFDVSDAAASSTAIAGILDAGYQVDIIVNNAGIHRDAPLPAISTADWQAVTRTTLDGFYNVTQPLLMPMIRRRRGGRILSISSVSALIGNRGQSHYAAAKAGLIGASKSLAQELARRKITVNVIAPGLINTDMLAGLPADQLAKAVPMRRLGTAQEVAKLTAFLAGEDAGYITGAVISINGGLACV